MDKAFKDFREEEERDIYDSKSGESSKKAAKETMASSNTICKEVHIAELVSLCMYYFNEKMYCSRGALIWLYNGDHVPDFFKKYFTIGWTDASISYYSLILVLQ